MISLARSIILNTGVARSEETERLTNGLRERPGKRTKRRLQGWVDIALLATLRDAPMALLSVRGVVSCAQPMPATHRNRLG
jgi:hypothetical protein